MIRIASGSGIALGINMNNVDEQTELASKETRCRLWCSVFILEHQLSIMTGRPSCLMNSFSANAPLPVEENQYQEFWAVQLDRDPLLRHKLLTWTLYQDEDVGSRRQLLKSVSRNPSMYFFYMVDLSLIAQGICGHLYGARAFEGWDRVERQMDFYANKLDIWLAAISDQFPVTLKNGCFSRQEVSLALNYQSVRIVLSRPCLSRPGINQQSGIRLPRSRFGNNKALNCIEAALSLLGILPEEPDINWIYTYSPWWAMLHFLMQAVIVLLIQMTVGPVPTKTRRAVEEYDYDDSHALETLAAVPLACRKGLRWLQSMAMVDHAWQTGFTMCNDIFSRLERSKHFKATEDSCTASSLLAFSAPNNPVPLPPPPHASAHGPFQPSQPRTTISWSYHSSYSLRSTKEQLLSEAADGRDANTSDFQFDLDQPYIEEALFPHNPTLDSDAAWLLSVVESQA
jgi:hypothetical protein